LRAYVKITGYHFDDFIFGISKHKLFITRYRKESPYVKCFTEDGNFNFQTKK